MPHAIATVGMRCADPRSPESQKFLSDAGKNSRHRGAGVAALNAHQQVFEAPRGFAADRGDFWRTARGMAHALLGDDADHPAAIPQDVNMNCKRISLIASIPASLLIAGLAWGQMAPPPPASAQMQAPPMAANNDAQFNQLAGAKGYVTKSEAKHDPWLKHHFSKCDTDQNGQVSQAEYDACHQPQGQPMPPPPPSGI